MDDSDFEHYRGLMREAGASFDGEANFITDPKRLPEVASMSRRDRPPKALRSHTQWVCWTYEDRNGDPTKPPVAPFDRKQYASTDDPDTWTSYDTAIAYHRQSDMDTEGVGLMLTDTDRLVGADLDGCRDPTTGAIEPWTRAVVDALDSYTEVSPSGTGLRVFVIGSLPNGGNRAGHPRTLDALRDLEKNK